MNKGESVQFLEMFQNMPHFLPSLIEKLAIFSHFLLHIEFRLKMAKNGYFHENHAKVTPENELKTVIFESDGSWPIPQKAVLFGAPFGQIFWGWELF